jgi:hypothetical protein
MIANLQAFGCPRRPSPVATNHLSSNVISNSNYETRDSAGDIIRRSHLVKCNLGVFFVDLSVVIYIQNFLLQNKNVFFNIVVMNVCRYVYIINEYKEFLCMIKTVCIIKYLCTYVLCKYF